MMKRPTPLASSTARCTHSNLAKSTPFAPQPRLLHACTRHASPCPRPYGVPFPTDHHRCWPAPVSYLASSYCTVPVKRAVQIFGPSHTDLTSEWRPFRESRTLVSSRLVSSLVHVSLLTTRHHISCYASAPRFYSSSSVRRNACLHPPTLCVSIRLLTVADGAVAHAGSNTHPCQVPQKSEAEFVSSNQVA